MRHAIVFPVWEYNGVSHFFSDIETHLVEILYGFPVNKKALRYSMGFPVNKKG